MARKFTHNKIGKLPKSRLVNTTLQNGATCYRESNQRRLQIIREAATRFRKTPNKRTKNMLDAIGVTGYYLANEAGISVAQLKKAGYKLGDIIGATQRDDICKALAKAFPVHDFLTEPKLLSYLKKHRISINWYLSNNFNIPISSIVEELKVMKRKRK